MRFAPAPVMAQSSGFSISPPILESVIKPGKTITQVFTITNLSTQDRAVIAKIVPFVPNGSSGFPLLKPNLRPSWLSYFSLANSFIELNKPFILKGESSDQLVLNIAIPVNAVPNDYYATLILTNQPSSSDLDNTNTMISTTIGANLLLTVNHSVNPATIVRIRDFAPLPGDILFRYGETYFADNLKPLHFSALAENAGQYLTRTSGLFRISKGKTAISLQSLLPLNLLAASSRDLAASPSGELIFEPRPIDIGPHKVEIDLRAENSSSHSEIIVFLLPVKISLGLFLGLVLLWFIIKLTSRSNNNSLTNPKRELTMKRNEA